MPKSGSGTSICREGHYISDTDRNVIIFHSSGTTGLPKAIPQAHRYMLWNAMCYDFKTRDETESLAMSTLPFYHGFGLLAPSASLSIGKPFCIPPASAPPTGASTIALIQCTEAKVLMSVPSILEEISTLSDDKGIQILSNLQYVASGGGPLKPSTSEKLVGAGVKILNAFGTTEAGSLNVMFIPGPDSSAHEYFRLRSDIDATFAMTTLPNGERRVRMSIRPPGWTEHFEVQDELVCNPRCPEREFRPLGRTDDVIVLQNGEKVMPRLLETALSEREDVAAALVVGEGRDEIVVLVEPASSLLPHEIGDFKRALWPTIVETGEQMDGHAKVTSLAAVDILPNDKKFPRSDKGAVVRRETNRMFDEVIGLIYENLKLGTLHGDICRTYGIPDSPYCVGAPLIVSSPSLEYHISHLIREQVNCSVLEGSFENTYDEDLFEMGMNSLQATQLRRILFSLISKAEGTEIATKRVPADIVYSNPSVFKIAQRLRLEYHTNPTPIDREGTVEALIKKYSNLRYPSPSISNPNIYENTPDCSVVLVTGTTGSLGAHLLAQLSSRKDVRRIICLNRRCVEGPVARQKRSLLDKKIILSPTAWRKIEVLEANTASPNLGLSAPLYQHLCKEVTHVVHNAWPMDFKRKVASFDAQFEILNNLLNFILDMRGSSSNRQLCRPVFVFVSSIAVVGHYTAQHGNNKPGVPEIPMPEIACALETGYAEAKFACEKIIEKVADRWADCFDAAIVRMGQMTGDREHGVWNREEHFPALVKSSLEIGAMPHIEGTASWIPIDQAAETLASLALYDSTSSKRQLIYHIENPVRQPWDGILKSLSSHLVLPPSLIPFPTWVQRIRETPGDSTKNPAKKLIEFFKTDFLRMSKGDVALDTRCTTEAVPEFNEVGEVGDQLLEAYVKAWKDMGFIK